MANTADLPEILFQRISPAYAGENVAQLSKQRYRQYLFLYSGKGTVTFDGRSEALVPGTVLSIPSQVKCELDLDKRSDGIRIAILEEFLTSCVVPAMPGMTKPRSPFWNSYYNVLVRREMTGAAKRKLRNQTLNELLTARKRLGLGCDPVVAGYMMLVMFSPSYYTDFNTTVEAEEPAAHREATDALVINFRQLVEKHFREHWSMEDYSHQLGVTPRRLLSACKHTTGKFPKALVHERIMREARADLVYSNKSISEIAYALGFESAAYFSRFYKRYAGVSPSDNPRPKAIGDGPRAH